MDKRPLPPPVTIRFESQGVLCAGQLHRPPGSATRTPLVVMCHGVGGTTDRLHRQAQSLARAGFSALAIDYRGWGRSEGTPRHLLDLEGRLHDVRRAVEVGRELEGIDPDRVALWGVSLGGAHVVQAAADGAEVVGVISQVPFNGFPRKVEGRGPVQTVRLLGAILRDRLRARRGKAPFYIPTIGRPGELALVATPAAAAHLEAAPAEIRSSNRIAPGGALEMMRYRPSTIAHRVDVPLLVCVAAHDTETPPELSAQIAGRAPHGRLISYDADHMAFYDDPELWSRVAGDQVAFLTDCFADAGTPGAADGTAAQ